MHPLQPPAPRGTHDSPRGGLLDVQERSGRFVLAGRPADGEVGRIEHLDPRVMLTIERRLSTRATYLYGIAWIIEPQPEMIHLEWRGYRIRAGVREHAARARKFYLCGSNAGSDDKVSMLKRPIKVPCPCPREFVWISPIYQDIPNGLFGT
jgi:hypothetical protein